MGDASSVRLAIAEETTFGTNPGSGFYYLRFNSESLKLDINNIQSAEIDPTRQPSGAIRVGVNASGDIVAEDSLVGPAATPAGFDSLLEGACMNDFSTIVNLSTQNLVITTTTAGTFKVTSSGTPFAGVAVGDWIEMGGFTTAGNGTIYGTMTAKTVGNNDADFQGVRSDGGVVTAETNTASGTVYGSTLKISNTKKSYTIQRHYSDLTTSEYSLYTGMRVARWNLRLNSNAIFQHTFGFLGQLQATTTTNGAGSPNAKWTTTRLEAVDHYKMKMVGAFTQVAEGTSLLRVESIDFTLDNALRTEPELGYSGSRDIGIGTPKIDGTIVTYMTNADLVRIAEAGTRSKIAFRLDDGTRARIISLNSILFGTPDIGAKGINDSVRVSLPFTAESDSNNIALTINRFA